MDKTAELMGKKNTSHYLVKNDGYLAICNYAQIFAWDFFFSISFAVFSITLIFHKSFGGTLIFLEASKRGS